MEGSFYVLYFSVSLFLSFLFSGQAECLHPFCCAIIIKSHPFLGRRLFVCLFVVATLRGIMGGCMHVPGEALGQISDCHLHNTASSEGRKSKFATVNLISVLEVKKTTLISDYYDKAAVWSLLFNNRPSSTNLQTIINHIPIIPNNPLSFQLKIKVESLDCQICFKSVPSIK